MAKTKYSTPQTFNVNRLVGVWYFLYYIYKMTFL